MVKSIACFTLNSLLLPLAITVGFSSPVLAAQLVDANNGISVDLSSIKRVSQGVYQYHTRIDSLKTPQIFYRNYYSYHRVDCANQRTANISRADGPRGDGRMHISQMTSIARSLQFALTEAPNRQTPADRMFILVYDRVQQNFKRGVISPDLEPDWDLKPESYIDADEIILRWP